MALNTKALNPNPPKIVKKILSIMQHYVINFVSDLRQVSGFLIKFVSDLQQVGGFLIKFVSDLRQVGGFLQLLHQ